MKQRVKELLALGVFLILLLAGIIILALRTVGEKKPALEKPAPGMMMGKAPLGREMERKEISYKTAPTLSSRLVIKSATLHIIVRNIEDTIRRIAHYAEDKGGWVVKSDVEEKDGVPVGEITVRVPARYFEETLSFVRKLGVRVTYEGVEGQDVTEEYVDLRSQLRNLEAAESQLLKIMGRAGKISDVMSVFEELKSVREEIERIKGRMQYLEQSSAMSTINVKIALSEELLPIPPAQKWRPIYVAKRAWRSTILILRGISYLIIWIAVLGVIWVPIIGVVWWLRRSKGK
jgi:hypothetical protein